MLAFDVGASLSKSLLSSMECEMDDVTNVFEERCWGATGRQAGRVRCQVQLAVMRRGSGGCARAHVASTGSTRDHHLFNANHVVIIFVCLVISNALA